MTDRQQKLLAEVLEIHAELEKCLGKISLDRLAMLSTAILISAALDRLAEATEGGEK